MDLESLDRRSFARSIQREIKRLSSRPIELSAIQNAKSIIESELKYLARLVADRNDPMNDNAHPGSLARDLGEELSERDGAVWNQRVVLDV